MENLVRMQQSLQNGLSFWGLNLLPEEEIQKLRARLDKTKGFLEEQQTYTSPGRLKNFRYDVEQVTSNRDGLNSLADIQSLQDLLVNLGPTASFLSTAHAVLPADQEWADKMKQVRDEIYNQLVDPNKRSATTFRQQAQHKLADLKKTYVQTYLAMHTLARLGAIEDKRKADLLRDDRLEALKKLSTIELMPRQHLSDFQNHLAELKSCFALSEHELDASAVCPHCEYMPHAEAPRATNIMLDDFNDELEQLMTDWTQTLLTNLEDPTTKDNLDLLKPESKKLLNSFAKKRALPDELSPDFINALSDVLSGLQKVPVTSDDLRSALLAGGSPATPAEMKKRFEEYLDTITRGKEPGKVRIVLD